MIGLPFVCSVREGSVITDFVVQTTQVNTDEINTINQNLPDAMKDIAEVIGSVTASYKSKFKTSTLFLLLDSLMFRWI